MKNLFDKGIILSKKIKTDPEVYNQGVSANLEHLPIIYQFTKDFLPN